MRGGSKKGGGGERGRERKTKAKKNKSAREEKLLSSTWTPEELDTELQSRRGKKGRGKNFKNRFKDENEPANAEVNAHRRLNEEFGTKGRKKTGAVNLTSLSEKMFMNWEELLDAQEGLKRRMDAIAAVHGWQGQCEQKGFLGGIEPTAFLESIQADIAAVEPTANALEKADLFLLLQTKRAKLQALSNERDRLAEDMCQLQEDCFEARDQLSGQTEELERLRQQSLERDLQESRAGRAAGRKQGSGGGEVDHASSSWEAVASSAAVGDLSLFQTVLSREQAVKGRQVVEALERLKLPEEASMGDRELACWHENKKTIMNSLKTLSSQIYSATTRILYEIIQNADDCSFESDSDSDSDDEVRVDKSSIRTSKSKGKSKSKSKSKSEEHREIRELHLECSDEALVAFHNEKGFQPKDLYSMCQVSYTSM
jgi:hypothetical protein